VYNLLETRLADAVIIAASLDKKGEVARAVRDWKRPGARNSGDFASVLKHVGWLGRGLVPPHRHAQ
jgi:hypothetical protein